MLKDFQVVEIGIENKSLTEITEEFAIIKKQIGMLNGTIQLESQLGIGSKFTVKIPITRC